MAEKCHLPQTATLGALGEQVGMRRFDGRRDAETVRFRDPGRLIDDDLELVLQARYAADRVRGWAPMYRFEMRSVPGNERMGIIDLRIANTDWVCRYAGHIGYRVESPYRGHRYAARSCRLLLPLAKAHGLNPLWITCNPDNIASRKTCEIVGARLVEIVDVPPGTDLYLRGEVTKCRYRLDLLECAGR
jgi:tagatose 1,6-diphosphate aldolase